jgi:uncharacterized membrane protein
MLRGSIIWNSPYHFNVEKGSELKPMEAAMANPKSTASIAGHPIHPMLISFPVAFFVATLVCDAVFWSTGNPAWATAGMWLLGAGIVMALLAAVAGLTDVIGNGRVRALNDAWLHAGGNIVIVLVQIYNWYARYSEGAAAVVPTGFILSLIVVLGLLFTGWKGWEMVYRHRVGVADSKPSPACGGG